MSDLGPTDLSLKLRLGPRPDAGMHGHVVIPFTNRGEFGLTRGLDLSFTLSLEDAEVFNVDRVRTLHDTHVNPVTCRSKGAEF